MRFDKCCCCTSWLDYFDREELGTSYEETTVLGDIRWGNYGQTGYPILPVAGASQWSIVDNAATTTSTATRLHCSRARWNIIAGNSKNYNFDLQWDGVFMLGLSDPVSTGQGDTGLHLTLDLPNQTARISYDTYPGSIGRLCDVTLTGSDHIKFCDNALWVNDYPIMHYNTGQGGNSCRPWFAMVSGSFVSIANLEIYHNSLSFINSQNPGVVKPDCEFCLPCKVFPLGYATSLQVTFASAHSSGTVTCSPCDQFEGTYILEKTDERPANLLSADCAWKIDLPDMCGADALWFYIGPYLLLQDVPILSFAQDGFLKNDAFSYGWAAFVDPCGTILTHDFGIVWKNCIIDDVTIEALYE
jgi:hypothetical protein